MNDEDGPQGRPSGEAEPSDLAARRAALAARLAEQRGAAAEGGGEAAGSSGYGPAMRLASEFTAAVVVGGVLGWLLDSWLGSAPWLMIVFLLLGFAAGILNALRAAGLVREPGRGGDEGGAKR